MFNNNFDKSNVVHSQATRLLLTKMRKTPLTPMLRRIVVNMTKTDIWMYGGLANTQAGRIISSYAFQLSLAILV